MLQEMIRIEFENFIQAGKYERTEKRRGYRNGSYTRMLNTRLGKIELEVYRDREGNFHPSFFEKYQRSEKALILAAVEMYFKGVSTRKITQLVHDIFGINISKSLVSEAALSLEEEIRQWQERPLEKEYPYLVVDARFEEIRDGNKVRSMAVYIIAGIDKDGYRDILSVNVGIQENRTLWGEEFKRLKKRGLRGVEFVVSDDHEGLVEAICSHFIGATWQRCQVHFLRDFGNKFNRKERAYWLSLLKTVYEAPDKEIALRRVRECVEMLSVAKKERIAEWLEENIEDTLNYYSLPASHRRRMRSTNMLERFNQEIKRRTRVIRIFPTVDSCKRLITALCIEQSEEWQTGRKYLTMCESPSEKEEQVYKAALVEKMEVG
jgi:transposase-like protein